MSFGHSHNFAKEVLEKHAAEPDNTLLALMVLCVENDIHTVEIAASLDVSREAIYKWIKGIYSPAPAMQKNIDKLYKSIKKRVGA